MPGTSFWCVPTPIFFHQHKVVKITAQLFTFSTSSSQFSKHHLEKCSSKFWTHLTRVLPSFGFWPLNSSLPCQLSSTFEHVFNILSSYWLFSLGLLVWITSLWLLEKGSSIFIPAFLYKYMYPFDKNKIHLWLNTFWNKEFYFIRSKKKTNTISHYNKPLKVQGRDMKKM